MPTNALTAKPKSLKHLLFEQPANRGTAVALIAALLQLLQFKPDAIVGIFPSDHYYANNEAFATTVKSAISVSKTHYDSIVLIGAKPQIAIGDQPDLVLLEPGRF
jgi:mannose-1-phosphate guanylyltransferase